LNNKPRRDFLDEIKNLIENAISQSLGQAGINYIPSHLEGQEFEEPYVDVLESDEAYVITAELAGVPSDSIRIDATKEEVELHVFSGGATQLGDFSDVYTFDSKINPEKIKAKYKNGILEVFAPKTNPKKKTRIKIE